jgi:hypothetical protein
VSSAQNSIIIAGVAANVSSPRNCIIIAGQDVYASSCRDSIVLSGGALQMSSVTNGIAGAVEPISVSFPRGTAIVNSPPLKNVGVVAGAAPHKEVKSPGVKLGVAPDNNPLEGKITLTLAIINQTEPLALFRRKDGDGEYVARSGQELTFPDGKGIPELAGWKLVYCGRRGYAVFEKDGEQALVRP